MRDDISIFKESLIYLTNDVTSRWTADLTTSQPLNKMHGNIFYGKVSCYVYMCFNGTLTIKQLNVHFIWQK